VASCPSKWAFVLFSSADTAAFPARDVCGCKDTPRHWLTLRPPSQDRLSKDSSLGLRDSGFCPCGLFVGDLGQGAAPGATKALWCLAPGDFPNFISRELRSPDHRITESQNGGGWKGPLWVTQPNLLLKQGHPEQAAQDCGQAGLEYLQRRRLHSLPGQPVPGLRHAQREEVLPPVQLELPLLPFVPLSCRWAPLKRVWPHPPNDHPPENHSPSRCLFALWDEFAEGG